MPRILADEIMDDPGQSEADFAAALDAADRTRCGPVAPPDGLYLAFVRYS